MKLGVSEIAAYAGGNVLLAGAEGAVVEGLSWDSREVAPGNLYVALQGEKADGHRFIPEVVRCGAAAVLATRTLLPEVMELLVERGCALVQADDAERALAGLAGGWRGHLDGTVVGVTGSSGKTTTKNLVRDVLSAAMSVVATRANENNELGVPRTVLSAAEETDAVVVEMGMRGLGQIAGLCEFVRPDLGLVTNIGTSHLELLGSREAIARAKGELLEALPVGGLAVLNADDEYTSFLVDELQLDERGVRAVFYAGSDTFENVDELGIFQNADPFVWASDVAFDDQGRPSFTMHARHFAEIGLPEVDGDACCSLELRGAHNVSNACAAAAVGLALGMGLDVCCAALAAALPEKGRQEVKTTPAGVLVMDDSYNANPDSMRAGLRVFKEMQVAGKHVAVLGDMGELGDYSDEGHRRVGRDAAEAALDLLVCVGPKSALIAEAARNAGLPAAAVREVAGADEALAELEGRLNAGDAVLVKASHAMELNRVVEGLMA